MSAEDASCTDHMVAWQARSALSLDKFGTGVTELAAAFAGRYEATPTTSSSTFKQIRTALEAPAAEDYGDRRR